MTLQQLRYAVRIAEEKSMNKAASGLYVTQPALSATMRDLEEELGMELFARSNRGIQITPEGEEFLGYARQMIELADAMEERFVEHKVAKKKFSVSMQHYAFAVEAFIKLAKELSMNEYEFAVHETKTAEVIENVRTGRSEIGILYMNQFNEKVLKKIFAANGVEFVPLFDCDISVYLAKDHPLASREVIEFAQLADYPCMTFEQGEKNSFYFAEEMLGTHQYKQVIKADDRATMLNMMLGLDGYTLCSGIICEGLNGDAYTSVPLETTERMKIGYIKQQNVPLSQLGLKYVDYLKEYQG